jgi:DNA-binding CsgD family transcriptional regulator
VEVRQLSADRKAPRYPVAAKSEATDLLTGQRVSGRTTVISSTGCFLRTATRFSMGAQLELRIEWRGETFQSQARVAHTSSRGMGLAFSNIQEPNEAILKRLLQGPQNVFARGQVASLTPREIQIIQLLAEGKSNKSIAHELGISARTVETHRAHVMAKFCARSLLELVYFAMDLGIVAERKRTTFGL